MYHVSYILLANPDEYQVGSFYQLLLHSFWYHHYSDLSESIELKKYVSGIVCPVCIQLSPFYPFI